QVAVEERLPSRRNFAACSTVRTSSSWGAPLSSVALMPCCSRLRRGGSPSPPRQCPRRAARRGLAAIDQGTARARSTTSCWRRSATSDPLRVGLVDVEQLIAHGDLRERLGNRPPFNAAIVASSPAANAATRSSSGGMSYVE